MKLGLSLLLFLLTQVDLSFAHSYKLDSYGCHNNGTSNVYECHSGKLAGKSWPNPGGKEAMLAALAAIPPATPVITLTGEVALLWIPNSESDLAGYKLYWGVKADEWQQAIVLPGQRQEVLLTGLIKGAVYYFALTAYDTSGNESLKSNVVSKSFLQGTP